MTRAPAASGAQTPTSTRSGGRERSCRRRAGGSADPEHAWPHRMGIDPAHLDARPSDFSGGAQQRPRSARARYGAAPRSDGRADGGARRPGAGAAPRPAARAGAGRGARQDRGGARRRRRVALRGSGDGDEDDRMVEDGPTDRMLDDPQHACARLLAPAGTISAAGLSRVLVLRAHGGATIPVQRDRALGMGRANASPPASPPSRARCGGGLDRGGDRPRGGAPAGGRASGAPRSPATPRGFCGRRRACPRARWWPDRS